MGVNLTALGLGGVEYSKDARGRFGGRIGRSGTAQIIVVALELETPVYPPTLHRAMQRVELELELRARYLAELAASSDRNWPA